MHRFLTLIAALPLAACAASSPPAPAPAPVEPAAIAPPPAPSEPLPTPDTMIRDRAAATRLLGAKGLTLQWIGWDQRGSLRAWQEGGTIHLSGAHEQPDGPGRLTLDGMVREIGRDYFVFDGTISITDTPDVGRKCEANKRWHFAVTQNRPYWRLREFEWCDGLTDYIDIYF